MTRDVIDRIGDLTDWLAANPEEAKDADWQAWRQLLIYAPKSVELAALLNPWRPIETAPKDGTHILAYRRPIGIRFTNWTNPPTVVHWFEDGFYTSVNEISPECSFEPTHWLPLPAPPSEDKA